MKLKIWIWVVGIVICSQAFAQQLTFEVNPGVSVFGVPFGSSSEQMVKHFGEPDGRIQLKGKGEMLTYGSQYAFIFSEDRFEGIRFGGLYEWKVQTLVTDDVGLPDVWILQGGIRRGMTVEVLKAKLGEALKQTENNPTEFYYDAEGTRMYLHIYSSSGKKWLGAIYLTPIPQ